jgi:hypothetical protein
MVDLGTVDVLAQGKRFSSRQTSELAQQLALDYLTASALIREAVAGLSQGACFTCGAEPGCNVDCKGCDWVARAERLLAAAEGPCRDCGAVQGHEVACIGELVRRMEGL